MKNTRRRPLEAALELIGDNTLLYQGLGEVCFQYVNVGGASGKEEEYIRKAESYAEKIFALEPESPRGYSVRAHVQLARGDSHGCGQSWRRVLRAFPKDVQALQLYTHVLGWLTGKPDVRGDARFGRVMERARREWERFEV